MEIYDAWRMFEKTGSIEHYLLYKNLCKLKESEFCVDINSRLDHQIYQHRRKQ